MGAVLETIQQESPRAIRRSGHFAIQAEKIDNFGIEALCDMFIEGVSITDSAKQLGVSKATLIRWVAEDADRSARAREARAEAAKLWDEKAEQGLEDAGDVFELSKAKELAHHYRWRASKIAPKIYGEKLQVDSTVKVEIDITQRKEQLRQMLDITPEPLTLENKAK